MNFADLQIGDYFRLPGVSPGCVYRKANSSQCSQNTLLQSIRSETKIIQLTKAEIAKYFSSKQEYFQRLKYGNLTD
ncbi:hypothetical protein NIES4101_36100 [Calothrix sp. NIES-4101]|nr:hypothetical protein NIES4101_36100 [Calothrix sp. NIES-4101]